MASKNNVLPGWSLLQPPSVPFLHGDPCKQADEISEATQSACKGHCTGGKARMKFYLG